MLVNKYIVNEEEKEKCSLIGLICYQLFKQNEVTKIFEFLMRIKNKQNKDILIISKEYIDFEYLNKDTSKAINGNFLKKLQKKYGCSLRQLGKIIGIDSNTIITWQKETKEISSKNIQLIQTAINKIEELYIKYENKLSYKELIKILLDLKKTSLWRGWDKIDNILVYKEEEKCQNI